MSCHDIGRGMNNVVSYIMDAYREKRLDRRTARELISVARRSVHYCDGNEGEAVECMGCTCGCCLRDGEIGEHMYNMYDARFLRPEITWDFFDKLEQEPDETRENKYLSCASTLCAECFDKIFDHHLGEEGAGAALRAVIEERGNAIIVVEDDDEYED